MTTAEDTVEPITDEALGEVCAEAAMIAPLARTMHTEPGSGAIYWEGDGGEPLGRFTDWGLARAVAVIVRSFRPVVARLNEARTQRDAALSDLAQARADLAEGDGEVDRLRERVAELSNVCIHTRRHVKLNPMWPRAALTQGDEDAR